MARVDVFPARRAGACVEVSRIGTGRSAWKGVMSMNGKPLTAMIAAFAAGVLLGWLVGAHQSGALTTEQDAWLKLFEVRRGAIDVVRRGPGQWVFLTGTADNAGGATEVWMVEGDPSSVAEAERGPRGLWRELDRRDAESASRVHRVQVQPLPGSLGVVDLNADGDNEIIVEVFGADHVNHAILDFSQPRGEEIALDWDELPWGFSEFVDLDGDRRHEIVRWTTVGRFTDGRLAPEDDLFLVYSLTPNPNAKLNVPDWQKDRRVVGRRPFRYHLVEITQEDPRK